MANVRFKFGTKAQYLALATPRDGTALYFCTDSKELYKGDDYFSDGLRVVASYANLPDFGLAADGILYYTSDTKAGYVLNETRDGWTQVIYAPVTDLSSVATEDVHKFVPTVGAVLNAINEISGGESATIPIATTEVAGKVKASDEVLVAVDGTMSIGTIAQSKVDGLSDVINNIYSLATDSAVSKGDVATKDELSTISDPQIGDVYTVTDTNTQYVYNGAEWVEKSSSSSSQEVLDRIEVVEQALTWEQLS